MARSALFQMRLTPAEKRLIDEAAAAEDMTAADWVRSMIFEEEEEEPMQSEKILPVEMIEPGPNCGTWVAPSFTSPEGLPEDFVYSLSEPGATDAMVIQCAKCLKTWKDCRCVPVIENLGDYKIIAMGVPGATSPSDAVNGQGVEPVTAGPVSDVPVIVENPNAS